MTGFFLSVIAIVAILCCVVAFAIKCLSSTPLRIVAVIGAITAMVVALPPLLEVMRPDALAPSQGPVAPLAPGRPQPGPGAPSAAAPLTGTAGL